MISGKQRSASYPTNSELAPSFSSPDLLASPPTTLPRAQKHSLSKPMAWLNRSASSISSRSSPLAALKSTRISEPRVGSSLYQFNFHRSGLLGSGATIVRTPQEALSGSSRTFELINEEQAVERDISSNDHTEEKDEGSLTPPRPPSPPSPPLPPLPNNPDAGDGGGERAQSASPTSIPSSDRSSDCPSTKTHRSPPRATILPLSRAHSRSIPALSVEAEVTAIPPQRPFEAILLSSIPDGPIEPSKVIVTLETCTTTYRTSLRTLVSRPSHLSRYVTSLLSPVSDTASICSNASDTSLAHHRNGFNSVFRDHLASSGCLPQSANAIHVFLDRPSAPYTHVLAYLRSLPGTPNQPETLPRAVQQHARQSPSSLESLLELSDEASYLGLEALYQLCCQEINRVPRGPFPTSAGGTLRGKTGSVRSFRTLVEQSPHQEVRPSDLRASVASSNAHTVSTSVTRESSLSLSCENKDLLAVRERSGERRGHKSEVGSPLPGWI